MSKRENQMRCKVEGVSAMCSSTCGTCSSCIDATNRMKLTWNENLITRDCTWVANKATKQRCNVDGVANACRSTCGQC